MDLPPRFDALFKHFKQPDSSAWCLDCKWKGKLSETKYKDKTQVCPVCNGFVKWSEK